MDEIRIANCKEDFEGIRKIWEERFTTDATYLDILFSRIMPHCRSYIHQENGEILSVISLMPMIHYTKEGSTGNGWYMFGVATLRKAEGRRLAANLVRKAVGDLETAGFSFIFERPAYQSLNKYYLNLGFSISVPKLPYPFSMLDRCTNRPDPTENILERPLSEAITSWIMRDFERKFIWEKNEILEGLIALGELREHLLGYKFVQDQKETYIAVNPLDSPNPEIYRNTFFCFPME